MLGRSIQRVTAVSLVELESGLSLPDWTGVEGEEGMEAFLSSLVLFSTLTKISSMIDSVYERLSTKYTLICNK